MTGYGVKIVRDDDLPDDIEWMFVKLVDGGLLLFLKESSARCQRVLAETWAAYRCLERPAVPAQRARIFREGWVTPRALLPSLTQPRA